MVAFSPAMGVVRHTQVTEDAAFAAAAPPSGVATSPTQDKTSAQDVSTSASPADESGDILAAPGGAASAGGSSDGSDTPAARLGYAVMSVLGKLALHAGCLEVLSDAATVRLLFYVAHCAPSAGCLKQALGLLRALAGKTHTSLHTNAHTAPGHIQRDWHTRPRTCNEQALIQRCVCMCVSWTFVCRAGEHWYGRSGAGRCCVPACGVVASA